MEFDVIRFPYIGITVDVDPVAFTVGSFEIYWYGIIIACALLLCGFLAVKSAKKNNFPEGLIYDIMLVSLPCALIGARLYYVFCEWDYYSQDLTRIFDTRSGGLAVYGGIIGALLGLFIMTKIRKIPFSSCVDYCIVYVPLGQAIGRWGNFFNQEAFGTTSSLPWAMTSDKIYNYLVKYCDGLDPSMPVHPTFLYESVCNLALFFILLAVRSASKHRYDTLSVYMIVYGTVRFLIEGLRTDSLYLASTSIRISQLLSLILVFAGLIMLLVSHVNNWSRLPFPERLYAEEKAGSEGAAEADADADSAGDFDADADHDSEVEAAIDEAEEEAAEDEIEEDDSTAGDSNGEEEQEG